MIYSSESIFLKKFSSIEYVIYGCPIYIIHEKLLTFKQKRRSIEI